MFEWFFFAASIQNLVIDMNQPSRKLPLFATFELIIIIINYIYDCR